MKGNNQGIQKAVLDLNSIALDAEGMWRKKEMVN